MLSVIGPRDAAGRVTRPTRVVSVDEACPAAPFVRTYEGVTVECAKPGESYAEGQTVPIRGTASADPKVPSDAVTASGSGLDPSISTAYARLQAPRVTTAGEPAPPYEVVPDEPARRVTTGERPPRRDDAGEEEWT